MANGTTENDVIVLTHEVLSVDFATKSVSSNAAGGISVFVGTTRDNFDGKGVIRLEYEAYEPMAVKEMRNLCMKAREKWVDIIKIAVLHRLGIVPIGEASVIIAVSSPHRREAIGKFFQTVYAKRFLYNLSSNETPRLFLGSCFGLKMHVIHLLIT